MRKKILFLITKATWGGAQKYVLDIVSNLPKDQFEPIVGYGLEGTLARDLKNKGIWTVRFSSLGRDIAIVSDLQVFFQLLKYLRHEKPDVVHLNSSKAAGLGSLAARIAGTRRIVFTAHGWPFKESRSSLARALIYLASWLTALLSHATIVVSKRDEKAGKRMWGIRNKIVHIPLGARSLDLLPPSEGFETIFSPLKPPPITPSTYRLISIGELTRNKGIRYAVEAVAELARRGVDALYVVAGDGEERADLERLTKERGIADRVYFLGFVKDASRHLAGFDALLLPSLKEGMPYVLLEAAMAGLPTVATEVIDPEARSMFGAAQFVPPGDEHALADAIVEISKAPRRAPPANHFSLKEMVKKTIELY